MNKRTVDWKTSQELRKLPVTSYLKSQIYMSVLSCPVLSTTTPTTTMTNMTTVPQHIPTSQNPTMVGF